MSSIDRYLQDLAGYLPRQARSEVLLEIRIHLLELADDWGRGGLTPEQAQARAVAQFGKVRVIGRRLRATHGFVGWTDVVLASLPALGITGLGWYFSCMWWP